MEMGEWSLVFQGSLGEGVRVNARYGREISRMVEQMVEKERG